MKACLNHARGDVTGRHYDQYDRLREKRRALELWSEQGWSAVECRLVAAGERLAGERLRVLRTTMLIIVMVAKNNSDMSDDTSPTILDEFKDYPYFSAR